MVVVCHRIVCDRHMVGKHVRVKQHEENIVNRKAWALVWVCVCCRWWCGFVVCCAVSGTTPVVLGVLVVIVAGSRPVVLFEPGC